MSQVQGASLVWICHRRLWIHQSLPQSRSSFLPERESGRSDRDCGKYKFVGIEILFDKKAHQSMLF